jgi:hypothetical protein
MLLGLSPIVYQLAQLRAAEPRAGIVDPAILTAARHARQIMKLTQQPEARPRVWWSSRALGAVLAARPPSPAWGTTVTEMTANGLYDWLTDWGPELGWSRCSNLPQLQGAANGGGVGVICAKRLQPGLPGHIPVVAPEADVHRAPRVMGTIVVPLQTQAGATNYAYFTDPSWQRPARRFRGSGFWYHSSTRSAPPIAAAVCTAAVHPVLCTASPHSASGSRRFLLHTTYPAT